MSMLTDTTLINFGISKISSAITKIAPTVQNISEKYVHYVVMKTVIQPPVFLVLLIVSIIGLFQGIKGYKKAEDNGDDSLGWLALALISGFATVVLAILFVASTYDATFALTCPEMFTVDQIIQGVQSK